jgi:oligosaccharide repeat unit polymerase
MSTQLCGFDIFNPAFITFCGFFISSVFCIYGSTYVWNSGLSWGSTFIVLINLVVVFAFTYIGLNSNAVLVNKSTANCNNGEKKFYVHKIKPEIFVIYIILFILSLYFYRGEFLKLALLSGKSEFAEQMYFLRRVETGRIVDVAKSGIIDSMIQFVVMGSYPLLYISINNYFATKRVDYRLLVLSVTLVAISLFQASRYDIVRFPIFGIFAYYLLWRRKSGMKVRLPRRYMIRIILVFSIVLGLFSLVRSIVGRLSTDNGLDYLSKYVGSPLKLFDLYLDKPVTSTGVWGGKTFRHLYDTIAIYLNRPELMRIGGDDFRYVNGVSIGNATLMIKSYMQDFGLIGSLILTGLSAYIFAIWHKYSLNSCIHRPNIINDSFVLILYMYCSFAVVLQFYGHNLYRNILTSFSDIKKIAFMYLNYKIFTYRESKIRNDTTYYNSLINGEGK